jgi:hypothetical protein
VEGALVLDFDLSASLDGDVLVVAFGGRVSEANVVAMVRRYFDLVAAHRPKSVLADVRALDGELSASRVYFLVRNLPQPMPKAVKTAFLERAERAAEAHYLESTAHNAGVELRAFVDRDAAMTWLRAS